MKTKYAGIHLEENGTYTVRTSFRTKDKFVKQITKRGFETAKKANDWKEQQKVYYKSKMLYELESDKTPIENLTEQYLKFKALKSKQRTIDNMSYTLKNHFVKYFKNMNFGDLSTQDIARYYEYIANLKMKNQSKNIVITTVLDAIAFFDMMEMIPPEINRRFKRILCKFELVEEYKNDYLEKHEIKQLLDTFDDTSLKGKMHKLMIYTFLYSGLRKSELLALHFSDIDIIKHTINVDKQIYASPSKHTVEIVNYTKTNKKKEVIIPQFLVEMFIEYMQLRQATGNDIVFTIKGKYLEKRYPNKVLDKHLEMANLKHVKIHDLRHTFCTMMYDMGAEEQFVAQQMGHASPNTSHLVYEHLTKDRLKKNTEIVENLKI